MSSASQSIFAFILNGSSMLLNFTSLQFPMSSQVPHFFLLHFFNLFFMEVIVVGIFHKFGPC